MYLSFASRASKDIHGRFTILPESWPHQFSIADGACVSFPDVLRPNFPDIQFKRMKGFSPVSINEFHHLQMIQKVQREMLFVCISFILIYIYSL